MKVGLAIRALLLDDSDVTAITTRIYPEIAVEGADAPYIVYSVVSNSPSDMKRGTPIDEASVEIYSIASTYSAVNDLADKVRAALDRKSKTVSVADGAVTVQSIHYTNEVTEVNSERDLFASVQDYTVRITR